MHTTHDAVTQLRVVVARLRQRRSDWPGVSVAVALLVVLLCHLYERLLRRYSERQLRVSRHNGTRGAAETPADDAADERHGAARLANGAVAVNEHEAKDARRDADDTRAAAAASNGGGDEEEAINNDNNNDNDDADSEDDDDAEDNGSGSSADTTSTAAAAAVDGKTGISVRIRSPPQDAIGGGGGGGSGKRGVRRHRQSSKQPRRHHHHHYSELNAALPTILLLIGVHGSGKTEYATQYVQRVHRSYELISTDELRRELTGKVSDYSREDEVEAALLREVERVVAKHHSCVIDDCQHNLSRTFRERLLQHVPRDSYNCAMKLLPIKTLFARTRIDKDIHEGKERYAPTQLQLEEQQEQYDRTEAAAKADGWILIS